jgi:hypothetical protein
MRAKQLADSGREFTFYRQPHGVSPTLWMQARSGEGQCATQL